MRIVEEISMIVNEVGLEKELFLLNKDGSKILEPSKSGFPADEMGFLVEIRSNHSTEVEEIVNSIESMETWVVARAKRLGFQIECAASKNVSKSFMERIAEIYHHAELPDNTRNLDPSAAKTHHTGFTKDGRATAGLHVHFSSYLVEYCKGYLVHMSIEEIVRMMGAVYATKIEEAKRNKWEYELKIHGFEYRGLPSTADVREVAETSLKILNEVM